MPMTETKKGIEDSGSEAADAINPVSIEPLIKELKEAQDKWMKLCEQAAIEQDPRKLLKLVTEINRLFEEREKLPTIKENTGGVESNRNGCKRC
jgi:hypothetical protein